MANVVIIEFEHMPWDNKRCYFGTYADPNKNNKEIKYLIAKLAAAASSI